MAFVIKWENKDGEKNNENLLAHILRMAEKILFRFGMWPSCMVL